MLPEKLQLKVFAEPVPGFDVKALVPVFHHWVKHHVLKELLIDVATYDHVPEGPGILLVGHGSDYGLDLGGGQMGLLYSRKRGRVAPADRLADCFKRAVHAAALLEADERLQGGLKFRTKEWLFRINDRRLAPNNDQTFSALRPQLEAYCRKLFEGATVSLDRVGEPRQLFSVSIKTDPALSLSELQKRLGAPAPEETDG